jgi:hypothetical protein
VLALDKRACTRGIETPRDSFQGLIVAKVVCDVLCNGIILMLFFEDVGRPFLEGFRLSIDSLEGRRDLGQFI